MTTTMTPKETIEWGKPSTKCRNKYQPIAMSGTLFVAVFTSDVLLATAVAEESPMQWLWGLALVMCLAVFIASLRSDSFTLLHYVADRTGIDLQYQIATGPLETSKLVHRKQDWSSIKTATYSTLTEEDASETPVGVVLTLKRPIEGGRTMIELKSDRPEEMMSLVPSQLSVARTPEKNPDFVLAIA
jgi:hypothetical protein